MPVITFFKDDEDAWKRVSHMFPFSVTMSSKDFVTNSDWLFENVKGNWTIRLLKSFMNPPYKNPPHPLGTITSYTIVCDQKQSQILFFEKETDAVMVRMMI
jgi:hypothetical protein